MKNRRNSFTLVSALLLLASTSTYGWNDPSKVAAKPSTSALKATAAQCAPSTGLTNLELNNVRALIETGGSLWQDRGNGSAAYEVPKGSGQTAIFAGSLWAGGLDVNGQLKLAAVRFRQGGNDFWTGPLSVTPGSGNGFDLLDFGAAEIEAEDCLAFDRFFTITRQEVDLFNGWWEAGLADAQNGTNTQAENFPGYQIPDRIINWPAHGDVSKGQDFNLAPWFDRDGDGVYNPSGSGDYPWYDIEGNRDCRDASDRRVTLFGDETHWWVFNDKGNIHTETGGDPIGMEFKAQAFAFSTNDEVNNMTFYNYEMINRGTQTLTETYFGTWVDADLGGSDDDFVGCDVNRGLGYTYNGDAFDDDLNGALGYGANPPAIGVDFFEGPYQDNDNIDNAFGIGPDEALNGIGYGDGVIDNERFGMRRFLYHNRAGQAGNPNQTDPSTAVDYYNYLRGIWLDGTRFQYGGNAHVSDPDVIAVECDFMFPGDTDPLGWGTGGVPQFNWTEQTVGNVPFDRRFMQSAGPFTLRPGALNNITVGVVFARALAGDPFASVEAVRVADDKAQALFDNCFRVLNGPDAPEIVGQELDRELILTLVNPPSSNNVNEGYIELDPFIVEGVTTTTITFTQDDSTGLFIPDTLNVTETFDRLFRFEGYQVYQVIDETIGPDELDNPEVARLAFQCDIKNEVTQLVNYEASEDVMGLFEPVEKVNGADEGIQHTFRATTDLFAIGNPRLINHKTYHYMAIAYGYNNFKDYDPADDATQDEPYKPSRKSATGSIRTFSFIPHIPAPEANGTVLNAEYGSNPQITRIEGQGNGGLVLDFTPESETTIVNDWKMARPTYEAGAGPINVKVIDPLNVPAARFQLRMLEDSLGRLDSATYVVTNLDPVTRADGTIIAAGTDFPSDKNIVQGNEQVFSDFGFSIEIEQVVYTRTAGTETTTDPLVSSIEYSDDSRQWLTGINDQDGFSVFNWIRSGTQEEMMAPNDVYNDYLGIDDDQTYEGILGGWWAPWRLVASSAGGPAAPNFSNTINIANIADINSIDVVITSDQSKWTRCGIIELQEDPVLAEGGQDKLELRASPSVGKDGNPDGSTYVDNNGNTQPSNGMGWFPGYAVNLETGERMNMAFGEDSWLSGQNGRDMKWNPTSQVVSDLFTPVFAGKHYIYVFNNDRLVSNVDNRMPSYDEGVYLEQNINGSTGNKIRVWRSVMWVGFPRVADGEQLMSTNARVRLRVAKRYEQYDPEIALENNTNPMYTWDMGNLATTVESLETAEDALDLINVVPNPYYAYSSYEVNRIDNRVKITNLPEICTVKIYTVSGALIRTFQKDSPITSIDWDLKNQANVPIAGGVYIIHVDVPNVGEKIVKWFGALRPADLEQF